ncbi:MAG: type IV pilus twitching motility protein PilT [Acidobacteriota bacterium]
MAETDPDVLLGQLAIHYKLLDKAQVGAALRAYRETPGAGAFADFLSSAGYLDANTVKRLVAARDQYAAKQRGRVSRAVQAPPPPAAPVPAAPQATAPEPPAAPVPAASTTPAPTPPAPAAAPARVAVAAPGSGTELTALLEQTIARRASDLHVHSGAPLMMRRDGDMEAIADQPLAAEEAERLIDAILTPEQRNALAEGLQIDFSYSIPGVGRFRANAYRQQRGLDAVFRAIPDQPPTIESLGLPADLERLGAYHQGMVLFTGPAGCGKSSTMAAMVDLVNNDRPDHILTVEEPIEYVFESRQCVVNQREVGPHTESFPRALRAALREDPDIIVIGELRDLETISLALTAAETGHLVMGTLHTSSAIRTINRLLGVFPPAQQAQIRTMVSESLRAVVSQRLVRRKDGNGRVPALEILINNKAVGNLIRDNRTFQIYSAMQTGQSHGMILLDASLQALVKSGEVSVEEARRHAEDPKKIN